MFARLLFIVLALALGLGASCGETNIEAINRLRPQGAEVRARLARIAHLLPPAGSVTRASPPPGFEPLLVLDFQNKKFSTDVLMASELVDPDRPPEFDLMLSPHLTYCLAWTGPKNPLDRSAWNERSDLGVECERAFRLPWLVVVRTTNYELPERIDLEVFVVDLRDERIVMAFPLHVRGRYTRADVGRGRFADEALRQLRSDAYVATRCALARRLDRLPGAKVDLRQSWLGGPHDPCQGVKGFSEVELDEVAKAAPPPTVVSEPKPGTAYRSCKERLPSAPEPKSLAEVDWCNREYLPNVIVLGKGQGEMHDYFDADVHDTDLYWLSGVRHGDLDADGQDEAVIAIDEQHYVGREQHPWHGTQLFVFAWSSGPKLLAHAVAARAEQVRVEAGAVRLRIRSEAEVCDEVWALEAGKLHELAAERHCTPK